jgi:acyl-CoA synthetase (NDP forming)
LTTTDTRRTSQNWESVEPPHDDSAVRQNASPDTTVKGKAALCSQSGGIGMAIIGFSRSAKTGSRRSSGSANKADRDEEDLLTFFEQDDATEVIAMHCEDLKDGRYFAEAAQRVSKKKPVTVLKAGRTSAGARAASSHTGALAGNDRIYDDVLRQSGVIRAPGLRERCRSCPHPRARTSSSSPAPAARACSSPTPASTTASPS